MSSNVKFLFLNTSSTDRAAIRASSIANYFYYANCYYFCNASFYSLVTYYSSPVFILRVLPDYFPPICCFSLCSLNFSCIFLNYSRSRQYLDESYKSFYFCSKILLDLLSYTLNLISSAVKLPSTLNLQFVDGSVGTGSRSLNARWQPFIFCL